MDPHIDTDLHCTVDNASKLAVPMSMDGYNHIHIQ